MDITDRRATWILAGALLSRNPLAVVEAANHLRAQPGAA